MISSTENGSKTEPFFLGMYLSPELDMLRGIITKDKG
jgi:hypothetical protein